MLKRMMFGILIIFLVVTGVFVGVGIIISAPTYKGAVTDHFDGNKFVNPGGVVAGGFKEVIKWMFNRERGVWKEDTVQLYGKRPIAEEKKGVRVTFINHSTFLIQVDGVNILTDPIWSKRTSPFDWAGPKRMRVPGIKFEDLPKIDIVIISHNHYDHLDLQTMRTLFGAFHPTIVTPLGVKEFLDEEKIAGAVDMDWWDEKAFKNNVRVQSVPAQHFSGRGLLDRDKTLWSGYVIKTSRGNIYFAGDTGYNSNTFKEIAQKSGTMKIALLPIGAYKPVWFMGPIHTSPEDAVKVHMDVGSELSIGMHFGTFPLADDGLDDPKNDLRIALGKYSIPADKFLVLKEGDAYILE